MFEAFKNFVTDFASGDKSPGDFDENDYRLAAAALLVHAAAIDGRISDAERAMLHALLKQRFELDDSTTDKLIEVATLAEQEAVDLYHFTSRLNRSLDAEGRLRLIEMMWQIAFSDGSATEFEENLIWRASELLGISTPERIALRQRVAGGSKSGA